MKTWNIKFNFKYKPLLYLACCLRPLRFEVLVLHDLRHDETLLKVGVDTAGGLGGLGVFLKEKSNFTNYFVLFVGN